MPTMGMQMSMATQRKLIGASSPTEPAAPASLVATPITASRVDLAWDEPDDGGDPIVGYKIERNQDAAGWVTIVADTGNTNLTYSDVTFDFSDSYTYRVSAINGIGMSDPSDTDTAITYAASFTVRTDGSGDYSTLSAAYAAQAGNYVNQALALRFMCASPTAVNDTTAFTLGVTQGSTPVQVAGDGTYARRATLTATAASLLLTGFHVISISGQAVLAAGGTTRCRSLTGQTFASDPLLNAVGAGNLRILNCHFVGLQGSTVGVVACSASGATLNAFNATVAESRVGFYRANGTMNCTNCLSTLQTSGGNFSGTIGGTNNASQDATAPGVNSRINQTFTHVNAVADNYRITSGDAGAKGFGIASGDAWDFGKDIDGNTWANPPSIGCNEP